MIVLGPFSYFLQRWTHLIQVNELLKVTLLKSPASNFDPDDDIALRDWKPTSLSYFVALPVRLSPPQKVPKDRLLACAVNSAS